MALSALLLIGAPRLGGAPQAQTQPSQTPASDRPVFRAGVDVVRLDIRVVDGSGKPVSDLRPDEVEVIDSGTKAPVVLFQHIAPAGRSNSEARQRTIAAEISTNQGAPRGHLYVLIFDQDHITSGAEQKVRLAAETFLRRRFTLDDRVAVYGLPGPGPSLFFTRELSAAVAQLKLVRGGLQRTLTPGDRDMTVNEAYEILRGNDAVINRFMTTQGASTRTGVLPDLGGRVAGGTDLATTRSLIVDQANLTVQNADAESRRFLDLVSQQLRTFRGVDGRKTVMLFSEGFHTDNISRSIKDVAAAAAETYSVIYSFDLNKRSESLSTVMATGSDVAPEISNRLESLSQLSADTNGKVILDASSHLDQALDVVGAAELDYYIIGFTAPAAALTNRDEYRHVSVRVTRPGARCEHADRLCRRARPDARRPPPRHRRDVAGPVQPAGTPRRIHDVRRPVGAPGIPASGCQPADRIARRARRHRTPLPTSSSSSTTSRPGRSSPTATIGSPCPISPHRIPRAGRAPGARASIFRPASIVMRCIVREPGGLAGSADRQFVVRSLAGPDPAASDLLLGTRDDRLPVHTVGYTNEVLDGAVRVYGRSEAQLGGLTASLDLVSLAATEDDGQHAARTVRGNISDPRGTNQGVFRDVSFSIPLADLTAGDYVAHAVIRAGGEVLADLRRQVAVIVGTRPVPDRPATAEAVGLAPSASPQPRDILKGSVVKEIVDQAAKSGVAVVRQAATEASGGRWPRALAVLAPAPAGDPDAGQLRALARIDSEDYASAVVELTQVSNAPPTDARLAFVLGWAQVGANNQVAAASAFRSAVSLDPTLVPAHLALAETYLRMNQPALAVQALEAGLAALPQSPELRRKLETIKKQG